MTWVDRLGTLLFRTRSVAPVPVALLVLALSWSAHVAPGPGGAAVDGALNALGLALGLLGLVTRFVTVGLVPAGTSGEGRRLRGDALNTTGPYAVVRHPLYLGNALLVLGLLCIAHTAWAWALVGAFFVVSTALIVRAEEALLRRAFPAEWEEWARRVPRWAPRWAALRGLRGPFAWRRAVRREVNPLVGWGLGACFLFLWEWLARSQLTQRRLHQLLAVALTLLVLLAANKVWKKLGPA